MIKSTFFCIENNMEGSAFFMTDHHENEQLNKVHKIGNMIKILIRLNKC